MMAPITAIVLVLLAFVSSAAGAAQEIVSVSPNGEVSTDAESEGDAQRFLSSNDTATNVTEGRASIASAQEDDGPQLIIRGSQVSSADEYPFFVRLLAAGCGGS